MGKLGLYTCTRKRWNFELLSNDLEKLRRPIVQCTDNKLVESMEHYKKIWLENLRCYKVYNITTLYKAIINSSILIEFVYFSEMLKKFNVHRISYGW